MVALHVLAVYTFFFRSNAPTGIHLGLLQMTAALFPCFASIIRLKKQRVFSGVTGRAVLLGPAISIREVRRKAWVRACIQDGLGTTIFFTFGAVHLSGYTAENLAFVVFVFPPLHRLTGMFVQ